MYKNRKRLQQMIIRYVAGDATESEQKFLEAYDDLFTSRTTSEDGLTNDQREQLGKKLENNILGIIDSESRKKIIPLWSRIAVAASICIAFTAGGYFLLNKQIDTQIARTNTIKIEPGSNRATLTLSNGSQIYLSQVKNGQIAAQGGVRVVKSANGKVAYLTGDNNPAGDKEVTNINTVSTPNGGQYEVTLPDGTMVWLNAASSLSFPTSFTGINDRQVSLKGEAYFEVAKDKLHPFIVNTPSQHVRVLGTHFNINAYSDESAAVTTLLEGSVRVSNATENNVASLIPGQQSSTENGKINVTNVIAEDAIAWKEGYFRFNNEPFEEVLKKIARWYNVRIIYTDEDIRYKTAYGTMSRFSSIADVVKLLELTKAARFKIQDDNIIVSRY